MNRRPNISKVAPSCRTIQGFTLVELMVALALSLFLIGGILLMNQSARLASAEGERLSRAQENMRFSSDYIVRQMRNAGFRDQLSLTVEEFDQIGNEFAAIVNDGLVIRYSGLGSCAQPFNSKDGPEPKIVEDRYFVENNSLKCEGSIEGEGSNTVELVTNVRRAAFEFICPADSPNCKCTLWKHGDDFTAEREILDRTCQGVRIGLEIDGPGDGSEPIALEMSAGFRNIILGRMMWAGVPQN